MALQRKYFINGEALVSIQTSPTAAGTATSVETTITKFGFQLTLGDIVIINGQQLSVVSIHLEINNLYTITFSDGSTQTVSQVEEFTVVGPPLVLNGAEDGLLKLGLSLDQIIVEPRFIHRDMKTDDFGPDAPADVMWYMGTANITMSLIHYDMTVLDFCLAEAMAGNKKRTNGVYAGGPDGLAPAGTPLGGGKALYTEGCHYVGLIIASPKANFPWNFPATYLMESLEYPLGTERTAVKLRWRAIPYVDSTGTQGPRGDWLKSENAVLWTHPTTADGKTTAAGRTGTK